VILAHTNHEQVRSWLSCLERCAVAGRGAPPARPVHSTRPGPLMPGCGVVGPDGAAAAHVFEEPRPKLPWAPATASRTRDDQGGLATHAARVAKPFPLSCDDVFAPRYEVIDIVGEGAYGIVLKCKRKVGRFKIRPPNAATLRRCACEVAPLCVVVYIAGREELHVWWRRPACACALPCTRWAERVTCACGKPSAAAGQRPGNGRHVLTPAAASRTRRTQKRSWPSKSSRRAKVRAVPCPCDEAGVLALARSCSWCVCWR